MATWRQCIQLLHCPLPAWSPLCLHGLAGPGPRCRVSGGSREGRPSGWGEKEALASFGQPWTVSEKWFVTSRNGWWGGGEWRISIPDSLVWLICCSVINVALVKVSFSQPVSLTTPWSLLQLPTFSFLASNRLSTVDVTLPFSRPLSCLCLWQKVVRDMLYPPSLQDVLHPWSQGPGPQFLS